MKRIECEITGTTPLLMHSAHGMEEQTLKKNPAKQYDKKEQAEGVAYRDEKGNLIVPARCLKACIISAASWFKFGRTSAKAIIAGCTRIEPAELSLGSKSYEIDSRPVVIQRARIIRHRPIFKKWSLKFTIVYNEELIKDTDIIRKILEESGQRIGLLDNRPAKYGENGCFFVKKFLPKR